MSTKTRELVEEIFFDHLAEQWCNGIISYWLVVWNIWIIFPFHRWDVILPIGEVIFFREVAQPPEPDVHSANTSPWLTSMMGYSANGIIKLVGL